MSDTASAGEDLVRHPDASAWAKPGFVLWHATLRWQRSVTAALKPVGLTHVQFVLLATVWWLGERSGAAGDGDLPNQARVAERAGTDVMMTSSVLRTLEARGLLRRDADPADARVRRLAVTGAGRELAVRAVAVVEAADARYFAPVRDRAGLLDVLRHLAAGPDAAGPDAAGPQGEIPDGGDPGRSSR